MCSAPGKFNEDAFRTLDQVLDVANRTGVRLIIPFVDNWSWWGGRAEYAGFRGKKPRTTSGPIRRSSPISNRRSVSF